MLWQWQESCSFSYPEEKCNNVSSYPQKPPTIIIIFSNKCSAKKGQDSLGALNKPPYLLPIHLFLETRVIHIGHHRRRHASSSNNPLPIPDASSTFFVFFFPLAFAANVANLSKLKWCLEAMELLPFPAAFRFGDEEERVKSKGRRADAF